MKDIYSTTKTNKQKIITSKYHKRALPIRNLKHVYLLVWPMTYKAMKINKF